MPIFIHERGALGTAVVEADSAEQAKERFLRAFSDCYNDSLGNRLEWVENWMPAELCPGAAMLFEGRANFRSHSGGIIT